MRSAAALIAFVAASAVSAQSSGNYTSSLDMEVDPNTVPAQERASWCQAQTNTCNTLCDSDAASNDCTQSTLTYDCTCSSNNSAPGLQYYKQTLPYFICNELYSQCITENTSSASGQEACKDDILSLCGTSDPSDFEGSSDSSTTATTATGTASATSSTSESSATGDSAVTSSSSDGLAAPTLAPMGKGAAALALGFAAYLV